MNFINNDYEIVTTIFTAAAQTHVMYLKIWSTQQCFKTRDFSHHGTHQPQLIVKPTKIWMWNISLHASPLKNSTRMCQILIKATFCQKRAWSFFVSPWSLLWLSIDEFKISKRPSYTTRGHSKLVLLVCLRWVLKYWGLFWAWQRNDTPLIFTAELFYLPRINIWRSSQNKTACPSLAGKAEIYFQFSTS